MYVKLSFHRIALSARLSIHNRKLNSSRETSWKTIVIIQTRDDCGLSEGGSNGDVISGWILGVFWTYIQQDLLMNWTRSREELEKPRMILRFLTLETRGMGLVFSR